ncbi:hypothetical protein [Tabrizicola sp.]|uniref:hypothetical protein n=1 Tax=Tabrizicola sp. TaxID=2005166 RepID=UPI0035B11F66
MIRAMLLTLALASAAQAETARILSGEHGDFTRLVIELPGGPDWNMGRTATGYAFGVRSDSQPTYDLSTVWERIPRSRLAGLAVDKTSGALLLTLGCDCHVFPFEYGSAIVVLDIREGPAPAGSAFEAAFRGTVPPLPSSPESERYDWLADRRSDPPARYVPSLPLDTGSVSLEPLRDELLEQIARGAADGVVDMELPGKPAEVPVIDHSTLPWSNIRIGVDAGVIVTTPGALVPAEADGPACAGPEVADLAAWGQDMAPLDLLVAARSDLYGEFDLPESESIMRSVRQLLYLGFGVEARQHLDMLGDQAVGEDVALYRSMARLVDGETDPQTPFATMLECDGPAALWAALAHDRLPSGPDVNRDAILQGFLTLPAHLRRHLGPALAEKFLARDDTEAVRIIRDAMERTPDADPGSVALLDAKTQLHAGDAGAAQIHAEEAVALDGDRADSLVALVEAHFLKLQPMDPDAADALMSIRGEAEDGDSAAAIERATVLALALSGQTHAAFGSNQAPANLSDLWRVVEDRATNDDFLRHAVLPEDAARPDVADEVAQAVADRLLALGFPDAAVVWLGPVAPSDPTDLRLLAARAELARRDAGAALALLGDASGPEADQLRADALLVLGDLPAAEAALSQSGEADAAARVGLWDGDWTKAPDEAGAWKAAARLAQPLPDTETAGLLDRGGRTVEASLAAREAIEDLLADLPPLSEN